MYAEIIKSIKNHYEKTKIVKQIYENYKNLLQNKFADSNNFTYNVYHYANYEGRSDNFLIFEQYNIIANSDKYVINFVLKPQLNALNYNKIIMDALFDCYLLSNSAKIESDKNYKRFYGKKIYTCIVTLDNYEPLFIDMQDVIDKTKDTLKSSIREYIKNKYTKLNNLVYAYYHYCANLRKRNEIKTMNSIEYTCQELKKYKNLPDHVDAFFKKMSENLRNNRGYVARILNKEEDFCDEMATHIDKDLDYFFSTNELYPDFD